MDALRVPDLPLGESGKVPWRLFSGKGGWVAVSEGG